MLLVDDEAENPRSLLLADIAALRAKLLENSASLIGDAELLFARQRYARASALSVIGIEGASKISYLLECAEKIIAGQAPDFHTSDLMGRGFDAKQAGETQIDLRTRYP